MILIESVNLHLTLTRFVGVDFTQTIGRGSRRFELQYLIFYSRHFLSDDDHLYGYIHLNWALTDRCA